MDIRTAEGERSRLAPAEPRGLCPAPAPGLATRPARGRLAMKVRFGMWVALLVAGISFAGSALAGPVTGRDLRPGHDRHRPQGAPERTAPAEGAGK
jgi:hypothetical protein